MISKLDTNQIGFEFDDLTTLEIQYEGIKLKMKSDNTSKIVKNIQKDITIDNNIKVSNNLDIDTLEDFDLKTELNMDLSSVNEPLNVPTNRDLYANDLSIINTNVLTLEEELEYFEKIKNGDAVAKNEFIKKNLKLVVYVAKKYNTYTTTFSDLDIIQEGNLGLLKAVDKFDPSLGNKFSTYAVPWIHQAIKRALEDKTRFVRIPSHRVQQLNKINKFIETYKAEHNVEPTTEEIATEFKCKPLSIKKALQYNISVSSMNINYTEEKESELGEILTDGYSVEDSFIQAEDYNTLYDSFNKLSDIEKEIITLHIIKKFKISHIERMLNIKRSHINKIINQALAKMRIDFQMAN